MDRDSDATPRLEDAANSEMDAECAVEEVKVLFEAERRKKESGESDYPEFFV